MRFLKSLDNLSFIILAVMGMEMTRYSDFSNFTIIYHLIHSFVMISYIDCSCGSLIQLIEMPVV